MATVDNTVRQIIAAHPTLFSNRTEVLHHILCVGGSGYDWFNGEPVDFSDRSEPWTEENCRARYTQRFGEDNEYIREIMETLVEEEILKATIILSNLDEEVQKIGLVRSFFQQSNGSLLMTAPKDVTSDWAVAVEEMKELAAQNGWKF